VGRRKVYLLTKISEVVVNKFPKISEGVYHNGTMSTVISEGLEKNCKFLRLVTELHRYIKHRSAVADMHLLNRIVALGNKRH
jgi:dsRNA-specific ribonuclease